MSFNLVDFLGLIFSPNAAPAFGDIIKRGQSGGWAALNTIATGALPTPGPIYQGHVITLTISGTVSDRAYVCLKSQTGTWSWRLLATG